MPRLKKNISSVKRRKDSDKKSYANKNQNAFFDLYPEIHGTVPEKMVYAALTRRGIPFYFLNDISFSDPEIDFFKEYQADFIIPSTKVIIEVQGARWHSTPQAIESDSFKLAVYESFGYKALAWWDFDIFSHLDQLITTEPLLMAAATLGFSTGRGQSTELTPLKRTKIDTSKGIRTLNAKKRKPYRQFVGTSRRKLKKVKSGYASNK